MKKLTLLLLALILVSCYNQEHNYKKFKTGKFEFTQEMKGKKQSSTFIRTADLQIETYNGKTDTATVRWVNDSEFILRKLHPKTMSEQKAISMKILFTQGNTYTFEYGFVGEAKKQRGVVTKLN
jgi:hypothetical protein